MSSFPPPQPAVELRRVSQIFGSFAALRNVSLTLQAGSSVMLLGENGAGKSTLLRLLAGLSTPTHGEVSVFSTSPRDLAGRIAYMGHATMLYDELTAPENLLYFARLHSTSKDTSAFMAQVSTALRTVGLDPANPRRLGEYSQGMRQRASLARVLMMDPDLLLLDEPFSNLDAASAQAMVQGLQSYLARPSRQGLPRTLVFTTHQASLARVLARTTLTLSAGQLTEITEITPAPSADLKASEGARA